jgi:hypothetical protein
MRNVAAMGRQTLGDNDVNRRPRHESHVGETEPGDEQEKRTGAQLREMDREFCRRMESALRRETRQGTASRGNS